MTRGSGETRLLLSTSLRVVKELHLVVMLNPAKSAEVADRLSTMLYTTTFK